MYNIAPNNLNMYIIVQHCERGSVTFHIYLKLPKITYCLLFKARIKLRGIGNKMLYYISPSCRDPVFCDFMHNAEF